MFTDFREKGREGERDIDVREDHLPVASRMRPNRTHNPGMRPDWEMNPQPFSVQDDDPAN